jgi:hypothetical protein
MTPERWQRLKEIFDSALQYEPERRSSYPAWSPLGNQIVYEYAETTGNIWLMELK